MQLFDCYILMNLEKIAEVLNSFNADFEVLYHQKPILTRKDALGYFKIEETAPNLIIKADGSYYSMIVSGGRKKVDFEMIKVLLNCKDVALATEIEIVDKFSLKPGKVPLIGHGLPCIMDTQLFDFQFVYGGTGDANYTLKIKPLDLEKANQVVLKFG